MEDTPPVQKSKLTLILSQEATSSLQREQAEEHVR